MKEPEVGRGEAVVGGSAKEMAERRRVEVGRGMIIPGPSTGDGWRVLNESGEEGERPVGLPRVAERGMMMVLRGGMWSKVGEGVRLGTKPCVRGARGVGESPRRRGRWAYTGAELRREGRFDDEEVLDIKSAPSSSAS